MQITETRSSYVIILDWTLFGIPLCKQWKGCYPYIKVVNCIKWSWQNKMTWSKASDTKQNAKVIIDKVSLKIKTWCV